MNQQPKKAHTDLMPHPLVRSSANKVANNSHDRVGGVRWRLHRSCPLPYIPRWQSTKTSSSVMARPVEAMWCIPRIRGSLRSCSRRWTRSAPASWLLKSMRALSWIISRGRTSQPPLKNGPRRRRSLRSCGRLMGNPCAPIYLLQSSTPSAPAYGSTSGRCNSSCPMGQKCG